MESPYLQLLSSGPYYCLSHPLRLSDMAPLVSVLAGLAWLAAVSTAAKTTAEDMGPAAFMWPADRVWSAAADNTAPCGSVSGVTNRTAFPLREFPRP